MYFKAVGRIVARVIMRRAISSAAARGRTLGSNRVKSSNSRSRVKEKGKTFIRGFSARYSEASELAEEIGEIKEEAREVVEGAYYEALDIMFSMCANAGQETVFDDYIIEAFGRQLNRTRLKDSWQDVDIGEYMAFMGEIVETGNQIMSEAFDEANSMMDEIDDIKEEIASIREDRE